MEEQQPQRTIAVDTETFLFGEQPDGTFVVIPKMVCTSFAFRDEDGCLQTALVTNGDEDLMYETWHDLLTGPEMLVFHNAAYDLGVCCETFPDLEYYVWDKIERGEVTDTKLREKLLNLSTTGNMEQLPLPDGSFQPIEYRLMDLVLKYLGEDRSADKAEDSVRTQYFLYSGWPASRYPAEANDYARQDASDTFRVFEAQQARIQSTTGRASCETSGFQVYADLALLFLTAQGMPIDGDRFMQIQAMLAEVLSEENMKPLIAAGILRPSKPPRPHSRQAKKVAEHLGYEDFASMSEEERWDIWRGLTEADRLRISEELGEPVVKWTAPEDSSIDTTALKNRVSDVWAKIAQPPKLTEKKAISTKDEVVKELEIYDRPEEGFEISPLAAFRQRQAVAKLVSTELPRMQWNGEIVGRVHFCYNALVSSGRTSSFASKHYPSANGQNLDPRARPCYQPEKGKWLASIDFSTLELCSTGQTIFDLYGHSKHRELINAGYDLHAFLGSVLARALDIHFRGHPTDLEENYRRFLELKLSDPDRFAFWRKFAKPVGLGFPGGLGLKTFLSIAKATYDVDIVSVALGMDEARLPKWEHSTVAWYAERMGLAQDGTWTWNPMLKGIALAAVLKDVWFSVFPEMRDFFKWITTQEDRECIVWKHGEQKITLSFTTPMGMHRTGCDFSSAANGKVMQSPSAEGAKIAVSELMKATRIGHLAGRVIFHNFVHDEVIVSVRDNPRDAADDIAEVQKILESSMARIMPDVRISTEAVLMERWHKEAKPVFNSDGLMVPWVEGVKYAKGTDGALYLA